MVQMIASLVKAKVSEDQRRRLELIDGENYAPIVRKVREEHKREFGYEPSQKYLDDGIFGLKQYYTMVLLFADDQPAVSVSVDPFWHAHILHTMQYRQFCYHVFGSFVDHFPIDLEDQKQMEQVERLYKRSREMIAQAFGTINEEVWADHGPQFQLICFGCKGHVREDTSMKNSSVEYGSFSK